MKKTLLLISLMTLLWSNQQVLKFDLDNDAKKDNVYIENKNDKFYLVVELSSQKLKKMKSDNIGDYATVHLKQIGNSFKYNVNFMRAGESWQFKYDKKSKRVRLIGMSRYEFGNAVNDGSGESSVNLLTNKYIGKWHYYNELEEKLIALNPIKKKTNYKRIYLENFSQYSIDDTTWYYEAKKKDLKKRELRVVKKYLQKKFPNYNLLTLKEKSFNDDDFTDYIVVLESKKRGKPYASLDDAYGRKVLLVKAWLDSFKIIAQNNKILGCSTCGGSTGDPFRGISVKGDYISFEELYGACIKEFQVTTFKRHKKDKKWYLYKVGIEATYCNEEVKGEPKMETTIKSVKDFGKIEFDNFNSESSDFK